MNKNIYIVYDKTNMKIIQTFELFGKAYKFSKTNNNYSLINKTHPIHKELLLNLNKTIIL